MSLSKWSVIGCGVVGVAGCAAAQVDDMSNDTGSSPSSTAGGSASAGSGSGGAHAGSNAVPSNTAGSAAKAGSSGGGTSGGGSGGAALAGAASGGTGGKAPNKPANTDLPYSEDFEDGMPQGFIEWNEDMTAGPWSIVDDAGGSKVYQPASAASDLEFAVGGSTDWSDYTFTVKVRLNDADSGAQIVMRFKDPKTYLVVEMAEGKYKLRGRANGSTKDLVSPSPKPVITAGTWYTVGVSAKGGAVSLTLDGTVIGMASADALISNGGIALGVAEGSVAFDDLSVVAAE